MSYCCVSGAAGKYKWSGRLESYSVNIRIMFRYRVHTIATTDVPDSNSCVPWTWKQAPRDFRGECKPSNILSVSYFCTLPSKNLNSTARYLLYVPNPDGLVIWTACNNIWKILVENHVVNTRCVTFKRLYWVFRSIIGVEDAYTAIFGACNEQIWFVWRPSATKYWRV
jgi:hypothetical protein